MKLKCASNQNPDPKPETLYDKMERLRAEMLALENKAADARDAYYEALREYQNSGEE